jgi:hypothetical protein
MCKCGSWGLIQLLVGWRLVGCREKGRPTLDFGVHHTGFSRPKLRIFVASQGCSPFELVVVRLHPGSPDQIGKFREFCISWLQGVRDIHPFNWWLSISTPALRTRLGNLEIILIFWLQGVRDVHPLNWWLSISALALRARLGLCAISAKEMRSGLKRELFRRRAPAISCCVKLSFWLRERSEAGSSISAEVYVLSCPCDGTRPTCIGTQLYFRCTCMPNPHSQFLASLIRL